MNPYEPEQDIWADVRAVAHAHDKPPVQPRRRPHPRLQRLAVRLSSTGIVIMTGVLALVVILLVILLATHL
jgi:hypothetical protein